MSEPPIVLVDRDVRTRPRMSWREAWATSRGHDLSTISAWSYARETVDHGGLRAVAPAALTWLLLTALFLAVALGAAILAASAHGSTTRAALILLASVVLSQVLTAAQNRRVARRLFIVTNVRVSDTPSGWAIAVVRMPTRDAPAAKAMLLAGPFLHVETYYYRNASEAKVDAYYRMAPSHDPTTASTHAETLLAGGVGRHAIPAHYRCLVAVGPTPCRRPRATRTVAPGHAMNTGAPILHDPRRLAGWAASADTLATVGTVMRASRVRGLPFPMAWSCACAMADDPGVLAALDATQEGWRRAYFREPASSGERALGFLFADDVSEDAADRPASRALGAFV